MTPRKRRVIRRSSYYHHRPKSYGRPRHRGFGKLILLGGLLSVLLLVALGVSVFGAFGTIQPNLTPTPTPQPTATPTPTWNGGGGGGSTPTPTPTPVSAKGELIIYFNGYLMDNSGTPNSNAVRIATAASTYGNPQWLVISNNALNPTGTATMPIPEVFIDYMHSHGVKVMSHCHTSNDAGKTFYPLSTVYAQIDAQMAIGMGVDGFEMDEAMNTASYYTSIGQYVKSHGYSFYALNTGLRDVPDSLVAVIPNLGLQGWVGVESAYYYFAAHGGVGQTDLYSHSGSLIAQYPKMFAGLTSNWYIWYYNNVGASYIDSPNAQSFPITENQAVTLVHEAWSHGIYYFGVLWDSSPNANLPSGDCSGFPSWWEDFISQL